MADRWIISAHPFKEHHSGAEAQAELIRLKAMFPGKRFRIWRVKTTLKQSNAQEVIADLAATLSDARKFATDHHAHALVEKINAALARADQFPFQRQIEGSAPPPDQQQPDTPENYAPANGEIGNEVSLSRVNLVEGEPA